MQISNHGGRCCGMKHIHGFPSVVTQRLEDELARLLRVFDISHVNILVEAALMPVQVEGGWGKVLEKRGFVLVSKFRNSNSGNIVSVFHFIRTPIPFQRKEPTVPPARKFFRIPKGQPNAGRFSRRPVAST